MTEEELGIIATIMRDSQQSLWSIYIRLDLLTKELVVFKYILLIITLINLSILLLMIFNFWRSLNG